MAWQEFDKSSKWMLKQHGSGILYLGGQARAALPGDAGGDCAAAEAPRWIAGGVFRCARSRTMFWWKWRPIRRNGCWSKLDDLTLAYQQLRVLPELLTLVLHPKGQLRITGRHELLSRLQWSQLACRWKVVELWTLPAEDLLAAGDVGLIPWVPLAKYEGPAETLLEQCRESIEEQARPEERENLLAVSQVMARLRFQDQELLSILGGKRIMIESPLIKEILAERTQEDMVIVLQGRFGAVPGEITARLGKITSEKKLNDLLAYSGQCPDLEAFRKRLQS